MVSNPLVIPLVVLKVLYVTIKVKPIHIELIYYRAYSLYIYILIDHSYNIYIYLLYTIYNILYIIRYVYCYLL